MPTNQWSTVPYLWLHHPVFEHSKGIERSHRDQGSNEMITTISWCRFCSEIPRKRSPHPPQTHWRLSVDQPGSVRYGPNSIGWVPWYSYYNILVNCSVDPLPTLTFSTTLTQKWTKLLQVSSTDKRYPGSFYCV